MELVNKHSEVSEKPGFMSKGWWSNLFSALRFDKYTSRDWGIWNLSSYATYGMVFGVFKPVAAWVAAKFPWLAPAVAMAWEHVTLFAAAMAKAVVGFLQSS